VDAVLDQLKPLLLPSDLVIDAGNSWFIETRRHGAELQSAGLDFMGLGVSGGEEGARRGPSLMPGCSEEAYQRLRPVLTAIAARTDSGPCVTHVGPDGAGHFVKMVHNGIEYGDMQLIAEVYDIMRKALGLKAPEIAEVFAQWNEGPLASFLIELTAQVLTVVDEETGRPLVDLVLDAAGQKGTGQWTVQAALELGAPIPTIYAALFGRNISAMKEERMAAAAALKLPPAPPRAADKRELLAALHQALYAAKVCSYAQGMNLIRAGSTAYHWNIDLKEIARVWTGGCIIRAALLSSIMKAYEKRPELPNLLLDEEFKARIETALPSWREAIMAALRLGIPVPALTMSLAYFDSYRSASLPHNLTQAQRDAFGAHTYQRLDQPEQGFRHTDWVGRSQLPGRKDPQAE
jgi:6-phosphogluconate dehydrogenase